MHVHKSSYQLGELCCNSDNDNFVSFEQNSIVSISRFSRIKWMYYAAVHHLISLPYYKLISINRLKYITLVLINSGD